MIQSLFTGISIWVIFCIAGGCGYKFRTTGKPIGIEIESFAIVLFESTSSNLGFEGDFTKTVREEFISRSKIPLVPKEEATAVFTGKVREIREDPLSYKLSEFTVGGIKTTYEITETIEMKIKLNAKVVDRITGKIVWEDRSLVEKASFSVVPDPLQTRYNKRKAVQAIARSLAERIYARTMERF